MGPASRSQPDVDSSSHPAVDVVVIVPIDLRILVAALSLRLDLLIDLENISIDGPGSKEEEDCINDPSDCFPIYSPGFMTAFLPDDPSNSVKETQKKEPFRALPEILGATLVRAK